ncbi:MAG: lipopolysaccharide kinase InaA family protein [Gemmataceae bacterium]|nr:lipopolysaccharide kinase InaA family protein [Gemmataceae bacterium]
MSQPVFMTVAGVRWLIAPEWRDLLLGNEGLRLDEWLRSGQAQVVKHGPHRTVYRVCLPGLEFHLKHNRLMNTRAWLRELLRPAKARIEYQRALDVAARGVPTIAPLAVGEAVPLTGPGDSFLITQTLENVEPLNAYLESSLPELPAARQTTIRQRLAEELGAFLARMHDAGVVHHDLHPGNLLLRQGAENRMELFLVDLHAVSLGQPLDWAASRANLTLLNRWFMLRALRTDRLRCWNAYARCRAWSVEPHGMENLAQELERSTWKSNLGFWQSRQQRCLVTNRHYRRLSTHGFTGFAVTDLDVVSLETLLADPDAPFRHPALPLLKDSRSATVAELAVPVNGAVRPVIFKRFRVAARSDPWTALLRRTPALRSWLHGHGLRDRGLPTPRPLAVFHRRQRGLLREGYLLVEKVQDAVDLHTAAARLAELPDDHRRSILRHAIERVAVLIRELHRRHVCHRDLKASNILVQDRASSSAGPLASSTLRSTGTSGQEHGPDFQGAPPLFPRLRVGSPRQAVGGGVMTPQSASRLLPVDSFGTDLSFTLIDLVGVTVHRRMSRRRRVQNLARIHASFCKSSLLTRTDKLRFLRTYRQWGLLGRDGWKSWWTEVETATHAKIARNLRSGRVLT